jgi:hypothetical protein
MTISFLPAGTEDTASSRIRVYSLKRVLDSVGVPAVIGYAEDSEIVIVQKKLTAQILPIIRRAKSNGSLIIYDVDDSSAALDYWAPGHLLAEMFGLAHIIITDTDARRDAILQQYRPISPVLVMPDAVDYYPVAPARPAMPPGEYLRIMWFGSISNISLFERYAHVLVNIPHATVVVVLNAESINEYARKFPQIEFLPWSRENFLEILQTCHITFLMHDGTDIDRMKSNNKMITSINWGVPSVVSNTPEYAKTATECSVDYAIFDNEIQIKNCIEFLRCQDQRLKYLTSAQPKVWEKYSPSKVTLTFLKIISEYIKEKPHLKRKELIVRQSEVVTNDRNYREKIYEKDLEDEDIKADYRRAWISEEGRSYRLTVYERQRKGGKNPLTSNTTIEEIKQVLKRHEPTSVLEVGCGWGRVLEELCDEYNIYGCDVSDDLLRLCGHRIKVFKYDIATQDFGLPRSYIGKWEVLFTRGVMLYLMKMPIHMAYAMNNMLLLAKKKILIWEWPEVCSRMKEISNNQRFEYYPIEHRSE